ncbi:5-formyltetrahydrofolate cyclo-ligase [Acetivibrio cellulolyticus]|uniref:5-formyltetrahydrofolate cyclo-ligase n=1 Tax=Acetivibrio cellulolyticus TaxID=35830 RepID=UPI0001E2FB9B|nr:5-formyltetrahydrofolate cyclo-ligase [Acetivibrio cellulolyticus]
MRTKKLIREEVACYRKSASRKEVESKSFEIAQRLIKLDSFKASQAIMCYMDFKNEVMTGYIIDYCFKHGKRVVLPLVDSINGIKKVVPYEVVNLENDLMPGVFGILEPRKDSARVFNVKEIDLVIVPGVAFDTGRNRIGYGAGFYDRFLEAVKPDCTKIGIAFEFQIYDDIPVEEHDIPLDFVITEERII